MPIQNGECNRNFGASPASGNTLAPVGFRASPALLPDGGTTIRTGTDVRDEDAGQSLTRAR